MGNQIKDQLMTLPFRSHLARDILKSPAAENICGDKRKITARSGEIQSLFSCHFCHFTTHTESDFVWHVDKEHTFKCDICDFSAHSMTRVYSHMQKHHSADFSDDNFYFCSLNSDVKVEEYVEHEIFENRSNFDNEINTHHNEDRAEISDISDADIKTENANEITANSRIVKSYCSRSLESRKDNIIDSCHTHKNNRDEKNIHLASMERASDENCSNHILECENTLNGDENNPFNTGSVVFQDEDTRTAWKKSRHVTGIEDKRFSCDLCRRCFKSIKALSEHMKRHSDTHTNIVTKNIDTFFKRLEKKIENTSEQDKYFPPQPCMTTPELEVCASKPDINNPMPKKYISKSYTGAPDLKKNTRFPHKCLTCHKEFPTAQRLQRHVAIHREEKFFKCDMCDAVFSKKSQKQIKYHKQLHDKTPVGAKFRCYFCPAVFSLQCRCLKHMQSHKNSFGKYDCINCEKMFPTLSKWKTHMMIHTHEKPYACGECGKSFAQKINLKMHEFGVHKKIRRIRKVAFKKNPCSMCSKSFISPSALEAHFQASHLKLKKFSCQGCNKHFFINRI